MNGHSNWEERLAEWRRRPEASRRRLAFWLAAAITLVILIGWSIHLRLAFAPATGDDNLAAAGRWQITKERILTGWKTLTK